MNLSAIETALSNPEERRSNLSELGEWIIYLRSTLENYFRTIETKSQ